MIKDVLRAYGRRWYVVLVGILLTTGFAYGAYIVTPPEYSARGLVLFLPSKASVGVGGNPFLALSGLDQPAAIVVAYFSSSVAQDDIAKRWPNSKVEVEVDDSTRGPVIAISVSDKTAADTLNALNYMKDQVPTELARLQQQVKAPAQAIITSMPLVVDSKAAVDRAGTIRMVIAAAVLGLALTGIVAYALDAFLMGRRRRRSGETPEALADEPITAPSEPTTGATEPSIAAHEPLVSVDTPSVGTKQPLVNANGTSVAVKQASVTANGSSVVASRLGVTADEPSVNPNEPLVAVTAHRRDPDPDTGATAPKTHASTSTRRQERLRLGPRSNGPHPEGVLSTPSTKTDTLR